MKFSLCALLLLATLPRYALASGFNVPWWGDALLFLLLTPAGWACAASVLVALVALVVIALRRGKRGP